MELRGPGAPPLPLVLLLLLLGAGLLPGKFRRAGGVCFRPFTAAQDLRSQGEGAPKRRVRATRQPGGSGP